MYDQETNLVVERPWVGADFLAHDCKIPLGHRKIPSLADGVREELNRRLRQGDGRNAECVESVDAATQKTETNANHPHADGEARHIWVILNETDAGSVKNVLTSGVLRVGPDLLMCAAFGIFFIDDMYTCCLRQGLELRDGDVVAATCLGVHWRHDEGHRGENTR